MRGLASPHPFSGAILVRGSWLGPLVAPCIWQSQFLVSYLFLWCFRTQRLWFDSGYMSRQFTEAWNFTRFLREGGPRILRSILGQTKSMPVAIPQVQCLILFVRQYRILYIFRSCRSRYFYDPLYLAVTCSAFACGVQDYGLFWKMTSGKFLYSILLGSTVSTCCVSLRRLFGFLRLFPVVVQRRIPMVLLFSRPKFFPCYSTLTR